MKAIWFVLLALAGTLLLLASAVFGLNDSTVLVPPPEAEVESFVKKLEMGRYPPALEHLSQDLQQRTSPDTLREYTVNLMDHVGRIEDVRGESSRIRGNQAEASALLKTERAGTVRLEFRLTRKQGTWAIRDLPSARVLRRIPL